ncbi:MAG TPA: hypothetical protein VF074_08120, partial [Pyrinomonadaceae bacterium]
MFPHLRSTLTLCLLIGICVSSSPAQTPAKPRQETITIRVHEGTDLAFDISPDGRSIVFDLLGQLWLLPAQGGNARAITNAVRDVAEDLDPSFSPDGHRVVFRAERNGRTGLWLLDLDSGQVRQLTQLSDPDGFDKEAAWSPDGRVIAFSRAVPPSPKARGRFAIFLLDVATGTTRELSITGVSGTFFSDPVWVHGGKIAFVVRNTPREPGGRIWIAPAAGGPATPITAESLQVRAPSFTADAKQMAYFALDSKGRVQVWIQEIDANNTVKGSPMQVSDHSDVTPTRIRWYSNSSAVLYSADGSFWKAFTSKSERHGLSFTAQLSFTRTRRVPPQARFPEPGRQEPARGFMGLALSPDGRQIGALALGKLWVIPVGGSPRAVADVPFEATSLAWSPDGAEVAWSAGVDYKVDLFATNLTTGSTRRITSFPGRKMFPAYSPDGRHLAFVEVKQDDGVLRVIDSKASNVADLKKTSDLGSIGLNGTCNPQWSPKSDGLLVCGEAVPNQPGRATFVPLSGQRQEVTRFPDAPIFLQWTSQNKIVFVRHDRLWEAPFDQTGIKSAPKPIGNAAALYASASRDGTVLFVSDGGLRLRSPDGTEQKIGWPISYTPPIAQAMLIKNVRIIDGTGGPISAARDILIARGRIAGIAPTGTIPTSGTRVLDAAGRVVMPGLMDLHAHLYRPDLLPGWLYFGVTTVRDQGASIAPLVAYADDIAAGVLPGPRVAYGGFQFYSDWAFDEDQGRGIEPEADPEHIKRAVDLAQAFGAQHIKIRTFRRWDINARMITEAHRRSMRATGHCSHQLPLVSAGMYAKEHIGLCGSRGNTHIYDDLIQLFRVAGIGVVPTISYVDF